MWNRIVRDVLVAAVCAAVLAAPVGAEEKAKPQSEDKAKPAEAGEKQVKWAPAVKPKPLSKNVLRGLGWLVENQLKSGAWGQGEESQQMGGGSKMKDVASVADTCMAALALVRSGSTPAKGRYAKNVLAAVEFVCSEIEKSDKDALMITSTTGTRLQQKLGTYVDTFAACMLLSEVQDQMPDKKGQARASAALDRVLHKMAKNQRKDGTWDKRGWAPALSQGMAAKGMNRAAQAGKPVDEAVRARTETYSRKQFDKGTGKFAMGGSAGVELYASASNAQVIADSANTNAMVVGGVQRQLAMASSASEREAAESTLKRFSDTDADLSAARTAIVKRLDDKQFIAGFGSNGGEEFLSYMNIGETLVVKGGEEWEKWDREITKNLNRIQNKDGSWTGHHCVTGRSFCTASSLLVLMVDRSPVPLAAKIRGR